MKVLISWLATNNDFKNGEVNNESSPNYIFHQHFYNCDKHLLLFSSEKYEVHALKLRTELVKRFPKHDVEIRNMDVVDVIGLTEIKSKVERLLLEYKDDEIDIFFSPGTSIMQVSWYICHTSLGLRTRLLQTKPGKFTASKKTELIEIETGKSDVPLSATLKDINLNQRKTHINSDYIITDKIKQVYEKAELVAQTDKVKVLISGESGTGKEHLAHFIHKQSSRKDSEFIALNCSAFQDTILESRLYGHKKGSFTDATSDEKGIFELANHGTILLDEIGDISPYMQQSLLRVLEESEIQPIGKKTKKVDVRVIAATNKDLFQLCNDGKFRFDLYYRLAVVELELPPLKLRGEKDKKELLDHFIMRKKKELGKSKQLSVSKKLEKFILSYPFPGNVRELENLIELLYVFAEDRTVDVEDVPTRFFKLPEEFSLKWEDIEKKHIEKVLKITGSKTEAHKALGYKSYNTFLARIKKFNIKY